MNKVIKGVVGAARSRACAFDSSTGHLNCARIAILLSEKVCWCVDRDHTCVVAKLIRRFRFSIERERERMDE